MFAISQDEIDRLPPLGKTIKCTRCGKRHKVSFAEAIKSDGTRVKDDFLAFVKCGKKSYLVGIAGRRLK